MSNAGLNRIVLESRYVDTGEWWISEHTTLEAAKKSAQKRNYRREVKKFDKVKNLSWARNSDQTIWTCMTETFIFRITIEKQRVLQ